MDLVMECENFVKDCDALYAKSLIIGFTAMEGEKMDALKATGRAAWEKLKELARKVAEGISKALSAVGTFINKLNPLKSKMPTEVVIVDPADTDILDEFGNIIGNVADMQSAADEMAGVSAKVRQAAANIEKATDMSEDRTAKIQGIIDELDEITERFLGNMKKGNAKAAAESDVSSFMAMEAEGRKFKISKIKDVFFDGLESAKRAFSNMKSSAEDLRARISKSANSGDGGTKKAGLYGKLLAALSKAQAAVHRFATFCGDKIRTLFNLIRKSKSSVSDYDGPEPNLT